jgi:hypothetical protein
MIVMLSIVAAVTEYLHRRDEATIKRSCETIDLGGLRSILRYRMGFDSIEVREYEGGTVMIRRGTKCVVECH